MCRLRQPVHCIVYQRRGVSSPPLEYSDDLFTSIQDSLLVLQRRQLHMSTHFYMHQPSDKYQTRFLVRLRSLILPMAGVRASLLIANTLHVPAWRGVTSPPLTPSLSPSPRAPQVSPPPPSYSHRLQDVVAAGALSSLQLEAVVYANMRHEAPRLAHGDRPGFFLGDAAGVGKGRQCAGMVLNHFRWGAELDGMREYANPKT